MLSFLVYGAPYFLSVLLVAGAAGAFLQFKRARKAPYFRMRRSASGRGWRWVAIAGLSAAGIIVASQMRRYVDAPNLSEMFAADGTPSPSAPALAGPGTPSAGEAFTQPTDDGIPTITPTQPTATLEPTPFIATIDSLITPPADATLTIAEVASGISTSLDPVEAGDTFPAGTPRIYFWVEYQNMQNGMSTSRALLLDGNVVRSESEAWARSTEGRAYYWFEAQGGWPVGTYEIQFYIGERMVSSATFSVVN